MTRTLTPSITIQEYAESRGVSVDKVLGWVSSGELVALNLAQDANGQRPRYRLTLDAVEEFERRRSTRMPVAQPTRRPPKPSREYV